MGIDQDWKQLLFSSICKVLERQKTLSQQHPMKHRQIAQQLESKQPHQNHIKLEKTEKYKEKHTRNDQKIEFNSPPHTESFPLPETDVESDLFDDQIERIKGSDQEQPQLKRKQRVTKHQQKIEQPPQQTLPNTRQLPSKPTPKLKRSLASREASRKSKAEANAARKSFLSGSLLYQDQVQQEVPANSGAVLRKESICELFNLSQEQARDVVYLVGPEEDPFWAWCFMRLRAELMRALIYKLREQALSKMRTVIVRRVLDDFVAQQCEISPEQQKHLAKHNRRITSQDIQRYSQTHLPPPPSRMTAHYLATVFARPDFQTYFAAYLSTPRLADYLAASNQDMVARYQHTLAEVSAANVELHVKQVRLAKVTRRPLFQSQIQEHLDEAVQIAADYCRPLR